MTPFWISAFLDFAPEEYDAGVMHWALLTGYGLSRPRGEHGEFATLLPNDGDPLVGDADDFLRVQRLGSGPSRIHLDLHVPDPATAAGEAESLGATSVADRGYRVMRSPGGFPFCFVTHPAHRRPAPSRWGDHLSLLDQVCLDIPRQHWERETAFWAALTGWELGPDNPAGAFSRLDRPAEQPLRILLQRLEEPAGDVRAHLDWATAERPAEVARHVRLGSRVVAELEHWTVLRGPGQTYCVTDRDPEAGFRRRSPAGSR